ncbi:hypothetical protein GCM10017083_04920 [Thalassobaculum fulvum]|uniref:Helix-turn-helix domain-containing protein n=1 Tax=Thalassobaculum fulvum TaxID=1633335 RepID=A0A918XN62_9PROT|nr:helix-turn-helix domain-containing protein [Thalassobaculum fulvum]GHD41041.1 hypothetical protein GCM10017083_04920 [Thalassobaculum fulvum]
MLGQDMALRLQGGELPDLSQLAGIDSGPLGTQDHLIEMPGTKAAQRESDSDANFRERFGPEVARHGFVQVPLLLRDLAKHAGLRPIQTLILIDLLSYWFHGAGNPFPGQDTIAADTVASKTTVKEALRDLEHKGLIRRERRHRRDNGNRTSDRYDLTPVVDMLQSMAKGRNPTLASDRLRPDSGSRPGSESGPEVDPGFNQMKSDDRARPPGSALCRADLDLDEERRRAREDLFG